MKTLGAYHCYAQGNIFKKNLYLFQDFKLFEFGFAPQPLGLAVGRACLVGWFVDIGFSTCPTQPVSARDPFRSFVQRGSFKASFVRTLQSTSPLVYVHSMYFIHRLYLSFMRSRRGASVASLREGLQLRAMHVRVACLLFSYPNVKQQVGRYFQKFSNKGYCPISHLD